MKWVGLIAATLALALACRSSPPPLELTTATKPISHQDACSERTVFVGDLGKDENTPRFRLLLEKSLRELGFTVVPDRQQADMALSGVMDVRGGRAGTFGERRLTLVYATVNVETSGGIVWTVNASPKRGQRGDHVAIRAREVAESVLRACRQRWPENN
jgi:hypothetical protein